MVLQAAAVTASYQSVRRTTTPSQDTPSWETIVVFSSRMRASASLARAVGQSIGLILSSTPCTKTSLAPCARAKQRGRLKGAVGTLGEIRGDPRMVLMGFLLRDLRVAGGELELATTSFSSSRITRSTTPGKVHWGKLDQRKRPGVEQGVHEKGA